MNKREFDRDRERKHKPSDHDRLLLALDRLGDRVVKPLEGILEEISCHPGQLGHFSMHVTGIDFPNKETQMPSVDPTPQLDLASSSVRAKITVVDPRKPDGSRLDSVSWRVAELSEPGALELEAAPDDTVKDENGAEILDPTDNLPLKTFSTYANTPLTPVAPARASGKVIASGSSMADCAKVVSYGDAAEGHFTMVGVEAPEA